VLIEHGGFRYSGSRIDTSITRAILTGPCHCTGIPRSAVARVHWEWLTATGRQDTNTCVTTTWLEALAERSEQSDPRFWESRWHGRQEAGYGRWSSC